MRIVVVLTCFNRKEKTKNCILSLVSGNPKCQFTFVVVDDNSSDGTPDMLRALDSQHDIHLLEGSGRLYYSNGMRVGMRYVMDYFKNDFDYVLMVNDDVDFYENSIEQLLEQNWEQGLSVTVGATCNAQGNLSYSAIKYVSGINYVKVPVSQWETPADTFNANCVLIPIAVFGRAGAIDEKYIHSLGDFDYGLQIKRLKYPIYVSKAYVGLCENNSDENTWNDRTLSRTQRIKKKESVKGAPAAQWFYFLKKNFGIGTALIKSVTPYIKILIGR